LFRLQLEQTLLEWASEHRIDHFATKLLLEQLTSEPFYRASSGQPKTGSTSGFTVIYDEVEAGVGWYVYCLRSAAKDEVLAVEEFRRQFLEHCKPRQWVWLLPAITVEIGFFVPENIKVFETQPKVVVLHWPDSLF
jgi:hypothetical protein